MRYQTNKKSLAVYGRDIKSMSAFYQFLHSIQIIIGMQNINILCHNIFNVKHIYTQQD